jgi:AcrR family transcriptional regulator
MSASTPIKEDLIQEQILQAAQQLFQQHGLHKVTMDDVAKAIGKGRSSLYYYYKSKDEIFDAVMDTEIGQILTEMAQAADKAPDVEKKLRAFCVTKLRVTQKRRSFFKAMEAGLDADEISHYAKIKYAIHHRMMKQEGELLKKILTYGMEKGELRKMDQKALNLLIYILLSSLRGLKQEMVLENDFSGMEPAVDSLTRMIVHGLKK